MEEKNSSTEAPRIENVSPTSSKRCLCFAILVPVLILIAMIIILIFYLQPRGGCVGKLGKYSESAVSSDAPICAKIGQEFLDRPGASFADAAIAAMLCMGVVNFHSMGLGGGSFYTIYHRKEGKFYTLDAREAAPGAATRDMYKDKPNQSVFGARSAGVPGEVEGFRQLHLKFGKLPWKDLFQPTIKLCRNGFKVQKGLHAALVLKQSMVENERVYKEILTNPETGKHKEIGEVVKLPKLARTLEDIANHGAGHFYSGHLADDIVKELADNGGIITKEDLRNYKAKWRTPVVMDMTVRGQKFTIATLPPPSSGVLVEFILKTFSSFNPKVTDLETDPVKTWHRFMEVSKFAYGARAQMGDSDFANVTEVMDKLSSETWMDSILSAVRDDSTHPDSFYGKLAMKPEPTGTAHLSILSKDGDAISATGTVNHYFGSTFLGNITGIMYNNEMDDFSQPGKVNSFGFPPAVENFIEPGKRPMSSMTPVIVIDGNGDVRSVSGASGGGRIISAVAQIIWRTIFFNQGLKEATDAARIYEQWLPNATWYNPYADEKLIEGLKSLGHHFKKMDPERLGAIVQTVERRDGVVYAYADARKGGCVDGN